MPANNQQRMGELIDQLRNISKDEMQEYFKIDHSPISHLGITTHQHQQAEDEMIRTKALTLLSKGVQLPIHTLISSDGDRIPIESIDWSKPATSTSVENIISIHQFVCEKSYPIEDPPLDTIPAIDEHIKQEICDRIYEIIMSDTALIDIASKQNIKTTRIPYTPYDPTKP